MPRPHADTALLSVSRFLLHCAQDMGEAVDFFIPMKRLFFQNETLWSLVVGKLKTAVELAAFRGSEPPKAVPPPHPTPLSPLFPLHTHAFQYDSLPGLEQEDAPLRSFRARARKGSVDAAGQLGGRPHSRYSRSIRRSTVNRRCVHTRHPLLTSRSYLVRTATHLSCTCTAAQLPPLTAHGGATGAYSAFHSSSMVGLQELQAAWKPSSMTATAAANPTAIANTPDTPNTPDSALASPMRAAWSLTEADAVGDPDFTSR